MSTEQIEAFFKQADADNSGTLTKLETCKILTERGLSVKEINDIFDDVDVSGDGLVTLDELKKALGKRDPRDVHDMDDQHGAVVMDFDSEDDEDADGAVGSSHVSNDTNRLSGHCSHGRLGEAELRAAFKALDTDNSGTITVEELRKVLKEQGLKDTSEADFKKVDTNADGKVDFEEFLKMWKAGL